MMLRKFSTSFRALQKPNGLLLTDLLDKDYKRKVEATKNLVSFADNSNSKIVLPPRTGPLVGRSVNVASPARLSSAIRQLNMLNNQNKVNQTKRLQRFAERPGKARLRIRIERKRREFQDGIRRLWDLTNEARRKGY